MPTVTGKANSFINFARPGAAGGGATVIDSDGKIKWAPHNLLLGSEQLTSSPWSANSVTTSPNSAAAPNGTMTADGITANGSNNPHYMQYIASWTWSAARYTLGIFAKKDTNRYLWFGAYDGTTGYSGVWDLQVGVYVGNSSTSGAAVGGITSIGDGWYLCTITFTPAAGTTPYPMAAGTNNTGSLSENADTSTGRIYLWGAHLYRSDLGGMQANGSAFSFYNPTTPKNLAGFSEAFDNANWGKTRTIVTPNAIVAPNGSLTADKVSPNGNTNNESYFYQLAPMVAGVTYTFSIYMKDAGGTWGVIFLNSSNDAAAFFNLATGTVGSVSGIVSVKSSSIESAGNGWYRCSLKVVAPITGSRPIGFGNAAGDGSLIFASGTTDGTYLWGAQLSDSASLDPYVPNFGAAPAAAAYYGPRLDHDPVTLAPRGLLVEEQRTNLLTYSQDFDNAAWTKNDILAFGSGSIANAAISPAGTMTADLIVPNTTSGVHQVFNGSAIAASTNYTCTAFVKPAGYTKFALVENQTTGAYATFSLSGAGTVLGTGLGGSGAVTALADGWYRCQLTVTSAAGQTSFRADHRILPESYTSGAPSVSWSGDGTSGIYLWGSQLEVGSFATSYIPTVGASSTRGADVVSLGASQFPYNQTEGSVIVNFASLNSSVSSGNVLVLSTGDSANDRIAFGRNSTSQSLYRVAVGGSVQFSLNNAIGATSAKVGVAYKANDFASVADGGAAQTTTIGSVPSNIDKMHIGKYPTGSGDLNGHIRQITYLPRRLSNAELQARTAA